MLLTGEGDKAYFNNRLLSLLKQNKNQEIKCMFEITNPCNLVDLSGKTLLHFAVEYGNVCIMEHLIYLGANVDAQDKQGCTPLTIAIKKGRIKSIVALLRANANIYVSDDTGKRQLLTLILRFAKKMPVNLVNLFFEKIRFENSADVKAMTKELISARCPLYCAVLLKNTSILKILLERSFPTGDRCRYKGNTVLHVAVQFSLLDSVKLLIEHGVDVNMINNSSETALMVYPTSNDTDDNLEILRILLSKGTSLTSCNTQGKMQIYTVLRYGSRTVVREMLQFMKDLSVKDTFGQTALHYLMVNKDPEIIEELKGRKFDVNALDNFGKSALHLAAEQRIARNIQFLLSIGANVNIADGYNDITPLFSVLNSNVPYDEAKTCIELLLRHGADIQFMTKQERTIFDIILEHDILKLALYHNFHIVKPILAYLALSEIRATVTLKEHIRIKINSCERVKNYYNFCRRKLNQMKRTISPSLSVILLKCLADSEENIMRFARDRRLALKLLRAIRKFPTKTNYLIKLRKSLVKALRITKLKKEAIPNLCKIKSLYSNQVVVDKIISYMNEQDLRILNQI